MNAFELVLAEQRREAIVGVVWVWNLILIIGGCYLLCRSMGWHAGLGITCLVLFHKGRA